MVWTLYEIVFFFFQAEDGIRYLVRSRGLGDVYKRQDINWHIVDDEFNEFAIQQTGEFGALLFGRITYEPVSYTHLTLPTSDLV